MNKILFVDDEIKWRGGQDSLFGLLLGMDSKGIDFICAFAKGGVLFEKALNKGWKVYEIERSLEISPHNIFTFKKIISEEKPDIVYMNTPKPLIQVVSGAKIAKQKPIIVMARRVVFPLNKGVFSRWKYRNLVDHFIAISCAVEKVVKDCILTNDKRVSVIHEGVKLDEFDSATRVAEKYINFDGTNFFCMSAFTREKGIDVMLKAFLIHLESHPTSKLYLAGEGKLKNDFIRFVRENNLVGNVHFLGFKKAFIPILRAMDVIVVPSLSEAFCRTIIYAMAASKPVIASRTGGIPEIVQDGQNGLLVNPGVVSDLKEAMDSLADDPEKQEKMGIIGRKSVESYFRKEITNQKTIAVFKKLLSIE